MKKIYWLTLAFILFSSVGCQKDIPEPEVNLKVIPMSTVNTAHDLPATTGQNKEFMVQHHVKGDSVFVECIIPNISFRANSANQGKIILYVDGKKKDEITTAAFIIKGMSSGKHHIKLDVVKPNNKPYQLQKEFTVSIS